MVIQHISHFDNKIALAVGQQCSYTCRQHTSVGISSNFEIGNTNVFALNSTDTVLKNKDQINNPKPGGDNAMKTYIFEAKSKGTTQLTMTTYMRGDVERVHTIEVVVG